MKFILNKIWFTIKKGCASPSYAKYFEALIQSKLTSIPSKKINAIEIFAIRCPDAAAYSSKTRPSSLLIPAIYPLTIKLPIKYFKVGLKESLFFSYFS